MSDRIELAKLIQSLREELATAWHQGQQSSIGFEAGPVELEVTVQAEKTGEVKGGVRFWVVEAGAYGSESKRRVSSVPGLLRQSGITSPLDAGHY